jgi:hypothetical protein
MRTVIIREGEERESVGVYAVMMRSPVMGSIVSLLVVL